MKAMRRRHPNAGRKQTPEHIAKRVAHLIGRPGNPGAGRPANTPEVLWSKVDKRGKNECWPWIGHLNEQGYGRTEINNSSYYAHRVIFNLVNPGKITLSAPKSVYDTGFIRHSCDNPSCCNPKHLLIGTHPDNMRDKAERGRAPDYSGDKGPNCKLTMEDVFWIKIQKKYGATIRALALLNEVSRSCISHLLYGRSYQEPD